MRDAVGASARFNKPSGIAVTPDGLRALVVDQGNHRVRVILLGTRSVFTLAGNGAGYADGRAGS